jgi:hypothetical protein
MSIWLVILIAFAALGIFTCTWKCGEWLSGRKAAQFAQQRERWRELEVTWPNDRDRSGD